MQFFKKNYEKILLGLILLGLVGAVVFLMILVSSEKQRLSALRESIIKRPVKPLDPPVLTEAELIIQRPAKPVTLDFSETNKVFNPLRWQRAVSGQLVRVTEEDKMKLLQVTNVRTLYLVITLDSVTMTESGARYSIGVDQQAGPAPKGKRSFFASVGEKKDPFILREVKGPADAPTAVVLELTDTGESITVSKDKPYRRPDGYLVDLKYPPENRTFPNRRVDSTVFFGGTEYKVVAITRDEVVLSAPNQKKWIKKFSAAP